MQFPPYEEFDVETSLSILYIVKMNIFLYLNLYIHYAYFLLCQGLCPSDISSVFLNFHCSVVTVGAIQSSS